MVWMHFLKDALIYIYLLYKLIQQWETMEIIMVGWGILKLFTGKKNFKLGLKNCFMAGDTGTDEGEGGANENLWKIMKFLCYWFHRSTPPIIIIISCKDFLKSV